MSTDLSQTLSSVFVCVDVYVCACTRVVDHSAVKLKLKPGVECSDYINANYIAVSHSDAHQHDHSPGLYCTAAWYCIAA